MTFELLEDTKVKITEVDVHSDKDRAPDTNPGAALSVIMTVGNDVLTMFDGFLRSALFMKVDKADAKPEPQQQGLEGVPKVNGVDITSDMPKLTAIGHRLGEFEWFLELSGYTLVIDYGLGGPRSNLSFKDCQLSKFRLHGKEGGSTVIKYRIEMPDVAEAVHGKLAMLKGQETVITLKAPVVEDTEIKPMESPFLNADPQPLEGASADSQKPGWPFPNPQTPEGALAAAVGGAE